MNTRSLVSTLALALALAGCAEAPNPPTAGLDVPKVLQVDRQQFRYEAAFPPGSSILTAAERAKLDDFLASGMLRAPDHVYISSAADDPLAAARVGRIVDALATRGIGGERVAPPPGGVPQDHLLLVLRRYVVQPPACPDWSADPDSDHSNFPSSNFGCANSVNLGMMVDDPRDLMIGRALGPAPAEPGLNAIERYRTDKVKALPSVSASGNSSGGGGSSGGGSSSSGGTSSAQ
jgi:pilus assembly protein CpaD